MFAALALLASAAQFEATLADPAADGVLGFWQTTTHHAIVEVSRCGSSICGHLRETDGLRADPQLCDRHNAKPELRQRLLKGLLMLDGFHRDGNVWEGGWIYNGEDGGTYHATLRMVDATHLTVRGCTVWPLCQSRLWTRAR